MSTSQVAAATPARVQAPVRRTAEHHGGPAVLELTAWCGLLLVAANAAVGLVTLALEPVRPGAATFGIMLAVMSWWALLPVLVVGWPVGVLTAWLLRREPREGRHVLAFALVGAVAAVLLGLVGRDVVSDPAVNLLLAAEGALGAGGGRLLLGRARRGRALRRGEPTTSGDAAVTP